MQSWQSVVLAAWYRGAWWLYLLRPLEVLFRVAVALRRNCYRYGLLRSYRAPVPVVVVGNITVGGTGKTPVVIALVDDLQQRGIRVGVISRGYGAAESTVPHRVHNDSSADLCGDEALVIQRRTGCPCAVASSREAAARLLLDSTSIDILISDDGLQHYALERDFEIALLDAQRGTGNGFCLPAGPLREPEKRLQSVDCVLLRNGTDPAQALRYEPGELINVNSGERRPALPQAIGGDCHAVAGIGQPQQFFDTLRQLGFRSSNRAFEDHHHYRAADFVSIYDKPIIMTEKDAVKCAGIVGNNAWYLAITAQLPAVVTAAVAALADPEPVTE